MACGPVIGATGCSPVDYRFSLNSEETTVSNSIEITNTTNPLIHNDSDDTLSKCYDALCFFSEAVAQSADQHPLSRHAVLGMSHLLECVINALKSQLEHLNDDSNQ